MKTSASPSNGKVVQLASFRAIISNLEKWLLKFSLTLIGPATISIEGPYHAAQYSWEVAFCFLRAALKSWCHCHQQRLRFMHAHQEPQTRSFWQDWCGGWQANQQPSIYIQIAQVLVASSRALVAWDICPAECFGCRLWFRMARWDFLHSTVPGASNPAEVGTKRLPAPRFKSLMCILGMYDLKPGCLEGLEDPGGIFKKKQNMISLLSALSLRRIQGCQGNDTIESSIEVSFGIVSAFYSCAWTCNLLCVLVCKKISWCWRPTGRTRCRAWSCKHTWSWPSIKSPKGCSGAYTRRLCFLADWALWTSLEELFTENAWPFCMSSSQHWALSFVLQPSDP